MKDININELVEDYKNGFGIYDICEKYKIGKIRAKNILKANDVILRKKGKQPINTDEFVVKDFRTKKYTEHEGYHYIARDRKDGFETKDYMNYGGNLTSHIEKAYGIISPTLYDRRLYYMRTGDYWWEQWFDILEVKDKETKKCPYCDWETNDVENKSGAFCVHIFKEHGMTKMDYLKEHPEDRKFFAMANQTANLQLETDTNKFVICKICGRKFTRITDVHLKKHGLTKQKYMEMFGLSGTTCNELHEKMHEIAIEANVNMNREFVSAQEKEISQFIKSFGIECYSDRRVLHGKELDIFVPSKNIAIEFNGNIWHSQFFGGKGKNYHLNKLEECNKQGVQLIQIFEDEFMLHKDIVLSKLKHVLKLDYDLKKVQGRKCTIEVIDKAVGDYFLQKNHIQGTTNCSIMFGAFYEGELVAVMALLNENEGNWNLVRYASRIDLRCQGVASKLFAAFVRKYEPKLVRSFADRRWTVNGVDNLYTKLGFKLELCTKPNYTYYNSKVDRFKRFHKFGFKKEILINKYGFDQGKTELEMTRELGYDRIWDCGLFKYVWRKEN